MADAANHGLGEDIAAALAWWRDAGVDCAFVDEPVNWLVDLDESDTPRRRVPQPAKPVPLSQPAAPSLLSAALPRDLAAFQEWWLAEPLLDDGRTSGRVGPRGPRNAELMVIVGEPERDDTDRLLSGQQGQLLDAMLAAMGIATEHVYLASALARHTPMPDWPQLASQGLGKVLCHHVAVAAPRRAILFGSNVLSLLANDPTISGQNPAVINHDGDSIPLLAAPELAALLTRPRAKARFWHQWLEWPKA